MVADSSATGFNALKYIVASLIVLGILGIVVTSAVTNHLSSVVRAITNAKD